MKKSTKWITVLAGIALLAVIFFMVDPQGEDGPATGNGSTQPADENEAIPIRTTVVERDRMARSRSFPGSIEAWEYAYISGLTGARIIRMHVDEGDQVEQGDRLAEMEQANVRQAEVQLNTARREVERLRNLVEIGAVSGQQLEQAEAEYENAVSNYEQLRENTFLTAPIPGVITDTYFVEGELFSPGADRPSIMTLMTVDPVKVVINLSERFLPVIERGMEVEILTDTWTDQTFTGIVDRTGRTVDPRTRTFQVEIRIENEQQRLAPGMFARVRLELDQREGLFLPAISVLEEPETGERYVYLLNGETVLRQEITIGDRYEEMFAVVEGLDEGDQVVTEGVTRLRDGSRIHVVGE